jgi:hypothetical protein
MADLSVDAPRALFSRWNERTIMGLALAFVVLVGVIGAKLIFQETPLSGDEVVAIFGSELSKLGHVRFPVPQEWQPFLPALAHMYNDIAPDGSAWASGYLPGNSTLLALFDLTVGAIWCSPVLAAIAVAATYGTARQIWPEHKTGAIAAAVLLAISPQLLVTAMTPFAMTSHLAVNAVWLWLFVLNRPSTHVAAMLLGVLGTGLHQFIFHPLFVGPFIILLMTQQRWRLALAYSAAYALIIVFWMSFPSTFIALRQSNGGNGLLQGFWSWLQQAQADRFQHSIFFQLTSLNISRLVVGLGPAFALLLVLGAVPAYRAGGILRTALIGAVLSFTVFQCLIPNPGYSWGYRYLHGQLGSLALIAAGGWMLHASDFTSAKTRALTAAITVFFFAFLITQAWMAIEPVRKSLAQLRATDADVVIIDDSAIEMGFDLARNKPDLKNRPLLMIASELSDDQVKVLCSRWTTNFFTAQQAAANGYDIIAPNARSMACPAA